ncbi:O-antigen ligase family protein [Thalassolituus maritimus]|uniref:O-antigen ligase family protein n=1 Tax=Thalassolituus maritimus TaxID=484498 RepID=UPI003340BC62
MRYSSYLFVACLVLPGVLAVNFGGLVITPLRAVGIFFFFAFVPKLFKSSAVLSRVNLIDILALGHCLWIVVALWGIHGFSKAAESGGMYILEFLPFYAFGRIIASNVYWLVNLLKLLLIVMLVSAGLAWIEMITGINVVYKLLGLNYGRLAETRMGLERASVYMPHPILYGLFTSMLAALMIYSLSASKLKTAAVLLFATLPSLSSAPLISMFVQLGATIYDKIFRTFKRRWKVLVSGVLSFVIITSIVTEGGLSGVIVNYLTFNPATGFYRMAIWEHGSAVVMNHPFFGIGYNDWERPEWMYSDTVDNFWLLTAMRYGLPALLLLFVAQLIVVQRFLSKDFGQLTSLKVGWIISFVGIFIVGSTVHFWANAFASYAFFLGIGAAVSSYSNNVLSYFNKDVGHETRR